MQIFDSHTHLNDAFFDGQVTAFNDHAQRLGVVRIANAGSEPVINARAVALAHQYDNMYAIVGFHPEEAYKLNDQTEATLIEQLKDPQTVAVGEIGLDYHQNKVKHHAQKVAFERQIEIAKTLHMPVQIHNRDAFEDTYQILKDHHIEDIGGVLHSFNGGSEWLAKFLDLGMAVSYSGVSTYKSAHEVHDSVKQTPLDRMLIETDAPYLAPIPYRGQDNEPAYTLYTLEAVARMRDVNPDVIAKATYDNTNRLFGIED